MQRGSKCVAPAQRPRETGRFPRRRGQRPVHVSSSNGETPARHGSGRAPDHMAAPRRPPLAIKLPLAAGGTPNQPWLAIKPLTPVFSSLTFPPVVDCHPLQIRIDSPEETGKQTGV